MSCDPPVLSRERGRPGCAREWGRSRSRRRPRGDGTRGPKTSSRRREFIFVVSSSGIVAANLAGLLLLLAVVFGGSVHRGDLSLCLLTSLIVWAASTTMCARHYLLSNVAMPPKPRYGGEDEEARRCLLALQRTHSHLKMVLVRLHCCLPHDNDIEVGVGR